MSDDHDGYFDADRCSVCGSRDIETETCWQCGGEGGFHDCGEDCCCCMEPELNVTCDVCNGYGHYTVCNQCIRGAGVTKENDQ